MHRPARPPTRASAPIAAQLALVLISLGPSAACVRGQTGPRTPPTLDEAKAEAETEADDGSEAGSVAVVSGETIEPDPDQLAAGVPYLRFDIEIGDSPARGPADAPVTIVMFSDFECPYCDQAFETIASLEHEFPGQIRFVYKALPLATHAYALETALVAHSAQAQGKFWEFHDLVFSGEGIDPETIEGYTHQLGLDLDRVNSELDSLVHAPAIRADQRVAKRLKLTSTPVFFVNGRMLAGARPKHIFRHLVDQELSLAERLADEGVTAAKLYDYTTQWGYTAIVYEGEEPGLDVDSVYPVPIGDSPTRGPADAPITIVAFSDFQCPFCVRGHETMEELRARYGDELRFVFKHFPLPGHPMGALASRASFAAAARGKFWEFHDAVFALGHRYTPEDLIEIASELQIPRVDLQNAMTSEQHDSRIEADLELGAKLMVDGTPAYFINGRPIVGAHPIMDFRMLIAEELVRVQRARADGVAPADIYDHLTGAGE